MGLAPFKCTVKHTRGADNVVADALSRTYTQAAEDVEGMWCPVGILAHGAFFAGRPSEKRKGSVRKSRRKCKKSGTLRRVFMSSRAGCAITPKRGEET